MRLYSFASAQLVLHNTRYFYTLSFFRAAPLTLLLGSSAEMLLCCGPVSHGLHRQLQDQGRLPTAHTRDRLGGYKDPTRYQDTQPAGDPTSSRWLTSVPKQLRNLVLDRSTDPVEVAQRSHRISNILVLCVQRTKANPRDSKILQKTQRLRYCTGRLGSYNHCLVLSCIRNLRTASQPQRWGSHGTVATSTHLAYSPHHMGPLWIRQSVCRRMQMGS